MTKLSLPKFLVFILVLLFVVEIVLEINQFLKDNHSLKNPSPYYSWQTHASSGERISKQKGILKLQLRPIVGYFNKPNQVNEFLSIDEDGYRGERLVLDSEDKVIIIGGSTAFATGLQKEEHAYSEIIRHRLAKKKVDLINAGVIGFRSQNELAYASTELLNLKPRLIISLSGWNDFSQNLENEHPVSTGYHGFNIAEESIIRKHQLTNDHMVNRLFRLPKVIFPEIAELFIREGAKRLDVELSAEVFADNMSQLNELAIKNKTGFIVYIQPLNPEADQVLRKDYARYRSTLKRILQERKVDVRDLNEREEFKDPGLYMDEVHLNQVGNEVLAKSLDVLWKL